MRTIRSSTRRTLARLREPRQSKRWFAANHGALARAARRSLAGSRAHDHAGSGAFRSGPRAPHLVPRRRFTATLASMSCTGPYSHIAMNNGETHSVQRDLTTVLAALNTRDVVKPNASVTVGRPWWPDEQSTAAPSRARVAVGCGAGCDAGGDRSAHSGAHRLTTSRVRARSSACASRSAAATGHGSSMASRSQTTPKQSVSR